MIIIDTGTMTPEYPSATATVTCGESYCYNYNLDVEDLFFEVEDIPDLSMFGRRLRWQKPIKRNHINRRTMFSIAGHVSKRIRKIRRSRQVER